jgi:ADP-ribose pyrophosphatase YjhB (NUDIX family)
MTFVTASRASPVPSVTAIVANQAGHILTVHKTDNDLWAIPGGALDLGESMPMPWFSTSR